MSGKHSHRLEPDAVKQARFCTTVERAILNPDSRRLLQILFELAGLRIAANSASRVSSSKSLAIRPNAHAPALCTVKLASLSFSEVGCSDLACMLIDNHPPAWIAIDE